ncbi:MAG TPA: ABC transporter ATP-binding protein [Candidatus Limnocylindrales bacterium]|nr:ABC transporter ATP-binding protein [Candidatus Limnocylindrales bacterium]
MVTLNINGVECRYGSIKILEGVNLSLKEGDLVGILGPNGSGKSTLLKSISRTLKPHKGTILLNEKDIYSLKSIDVAKQMGVVPQDNVISFAFTALEVVLMGRSPHLSRFQMETANDMAIAHKVMSLTNTWHLAARPVNELSGGERQRVIIARALAQEPKVLLLDEPLTYLDIVNQLEIMDLVKSLCIKEGIIVMTVVHDLNLAARYCSEALLLKNGKVFAAGSLDHVLTSENIKSVFQVDAIVKKNAVTNSLYVIPLSPSKPSPPKNCAIHLICGAGTGTELMKIFLDEGYNVTAGVLNVLDTDFETAQLLNIQVASEAPFSPVTERTVKTNLAMISKANFVVISSVPFGYGNLPNLIAAKEALNRGIPVMVIDQVPIENRDFTGGHAKALMEELKSLGAVFVKNQYELLTKLNISLEKTKLPEELSSTIAGHLKDLTLQEKNPTVRGSTEK